METIKSKHNIKLTDAIKALLGILSVVRILVPSFDAWYKEEKTMFLSAFDLLLLFWVPVLNIFGQWIKKKKLPGWVPPTPILIVLAAFLICGVSGGLRIHAEGTALYAQVVWYAIANGCLISFISIAAYDIVKGIWTTQWKWFREKMSKFIAKLKEGKKA